MVVCTIDRPAALDLCLEALHRQTRPPDEVIVVDNTSGDTLTRELAGRWEARYLTEPKRGLSRARNRGALAARSAVVAFTDDDAVPEAAWVEALAGEFADPRVAAAAGRVLPLELRTEAQRLFDAAGGVTRNAARRLSLDRGTPYWFEMAHFGGIGAGGNMAFRRDLFEQGLRFDECLGRGAPLGGGEEHFAFFRVLARGQAVTYCPTAIVRHAYPATLRQLRDEHLFTVSCSAAYIGKLLAELPQHRRETLRFLLAWLSGRPLGAWAVSAAPARSFAPAWLTAAALFGGFLRYGAFRLTGR
ncbi:MAG: glycosyltransferase family 2 protein [Chloroflexi bacterium]|nr:glycosyltransferase family 2 protein [Chloroflexota bacterium]